MKYNLCISIPVKNTSIEEIKPILDKAIESKPNYIELRFDYISDIKILSLDFIRGLLNIIQPHIAAIFTLRDSSEGGHLTIDQRERLKILKLCIEAKPDYIDIEMNTDKSILDELINFACQNEVKPIFSYHNLETTMTFNESINFIHNFNETLTQDMFLNSKFLDDFVYKVIFIAQTFEDNLVPLKICKEFLNSNQKIISFCMGELGLFSRIMCVFVGSFLTYTFLEEQTAPGQINFNRMKEIYTLILNNQ